MSKNSDSTLFFVVSIFLVFFGICCGIALDGYYQHLEHMEVMNSLPIVQFES